MIEAFLLGTGLLVLSIFYLAAYVGGVYSVEEGSLFGAVATIALTAVGLHYLGGIDVLALFGSEWYITLGKIGLFVIAGGLYTLIWGWPTFIRNNVPDYIEEFEGENRLIAERNERVPVNRGLLLEPEPLLTFEEFINSPRYPGRALMHKELISVLVILWPWALTWELLRKPARWIWNNLYRMFGETLDKISKSISRKAYANATREVNNKN